MFSWLIRKQWDFGGHTFLSWEKDNGRWSVSNESLLRVASACSILGLTSKVAGISIDVFVSIVSVLASLAPALPKNISIKVLDLIDCMSPRCSLL